MVFVSSAENNGDTYYTVDITVGGQTLEVVPDTGSFSLLVTSTNCHGCPHQGWNATASSSWEPLDEYARITFGSGPVAVRGGFEKVGVPEASGSSSAERENSETVETEKTAKQKIFEIIRMGDGMRQIWESGADFDGIMGLGMTSIAPGSDGPSPVDAKKKSDGEATLLANLGIEKFGMCLGADTDSVTSRVYLFTLKLNSKFESLNCIRV